jgi:hypothetical protein
MEWLSRQNSKNKIRNLGRLAKDETSIGKRHEHATVVINIETGDPVFARQGKSQSATRAVLEAPRRQEA